MNTYKKRIECLCSWMQGQNIDAVVIEDAENRRSKDLRYLSGMASDALLIIFSDTSSFLVAWDILMAEKTATADKIIAYADFDRNYVKAVKDICNAKLQSGQIEFASSTPHILFAELQYELSEFEILCRADGVSEKLLSMRAVKDESEIAIYKRAGKMTDKLINSIEKGFLDGSIKTEVDTAMLIEAEGRQLGAEGSSFETLAAGAARSWAIHCIPAYGTGAIGTAIPGKSGGLSIIDCGLTVEGYATDITMTICRGKLSEKQQQMIDLTRESHRIAAEWVSKPNISTAQTARIVDDFFKEAGWVMPHSLGHGIGLDVHEAPILKNHPLYDRPLIPGMVFTLEPGLYDAEAGGVRFENDYLMTETGGFPLTSSKIVFLD